MCLPSKRTQAGEQDNQAGRQANSIRIVWMCVFFYPNIQCSNFVYGLLRFFLLGHTHTIECSWQFQSCAVISNKHQYIHISIGQIQVHIDKYTYNRSNTQAHIIHVKWMPCRNCNGCLCANVSRMNVCVWVRVRHIVFVRLCVCVFLCTRCVWKVFKRIFRNI